MSTRVSRLTDQDIVRIIREEYEKRLELLDEKLKMFFKTEGGDEKSVLSPDLKIRKKTGELYTIDQVGTWGAILSWVDEEGVHTKKVDRETLEKDYTL